MVGGGYLEAGLDATATAVGFFVDVEYDSSLNVTNLALDARFGEV